MSEELELELEDLEDISGKPKLHYSVEALRVLPPVFDPEAFDKMPSEFELKHALLIIEMGTHLVPDSETRIHDAREYIRQSLEKRHGKKVISNDEWVNLRGLASIPIYESVQKGETIVL